MDAWHWIGAAIEAVLLTILVLLWYDSLREDPKWTTPQATKRAAVAAIVIPVGFVTVLIVPPWVAGVLIAIPLTAIIVMAMAS